MTRPKISYKEKLAALLGCEEYEIDYGDALYYRIGSPPGVEHLYNRRDIERLWNETTTHVWENDTLRYTQTLDKNGRIIDVQSEQIRKDSP